MSYNHEEETKDNRKVISVSRFYEGLDLDGKNPKRIEPAELLDFYEMCRINALSKFWEDNLDNTWIQNIEDLIIGLCKNNSSNNFSITLAVLGNSKEISVYVSLGSLLETKQRLKSILPGIQLDKIAYKQLGTKRKDHFRHTGVIRGIPNRQVKGGKIDHFPLERIIRGMKGSTWSYVVTAHPRSREEVLKNHGILLDHLTDFSKISRQSIQETEHTGKQVDQRNNSSITSTTSREFINWRVEHLLEVLQIEKLRLEESLFTGQWMVNAVLGADEPTTLERLAGLALGVFGGEHSRPVPIQSHLSSSDGIPYKDFHTCLTSLELAVLLELPRREVPGYAIHDFVEYDVDFSLPKNDPVIIGQILFDGELSGHSFGIPLNDLSKHGVVVGVTGSGKTTSVMSLLQCIYEGGLPFCVIEPAKTEYRALLGKITGGEANGPIPTLRVYTLGNETVAPFRLNPFEFEIGAEQGMVSVLSHIDHLKAVFNAAFILYAPMPYVLETALHEVYEDKGWDLATGRNERISDAEWVESQSYPIFPTLTDLYRKIDIVVLRLGYDTRLTQDIRAGLKARLGSLRLGSKGLMLDTAHGIPMKDLLTNPTVIELENIGNDDEKTFIMGLLLLRLYEYRRLQVISDELPPDFQHLLVIEEAHRLLANVSTQVGTDTVNPRAQAVETFVNMLSEIRAYKQGVLVAEQIPSKLTPDIVKNTNLKIVHRMLAQDDRQLLGSTMNMTESQIQHLSVLSPGIAAIYAEGADHPYLVQVEDLRALQSLGLLKDSELSSYSKKYISLQHTLHIPNWLSYINGNTFDAPDALPYQEAGKLIENDGNRMWANVLLCILCNRKHLSNTIVEIRRRISNKLSSSQQQQAFRWFLVRASAEELMERAAENGWTYSSTDSMLRDLTKGITNFIATGNPQNVELDNFVGKYEGYLTDTNDKKGGFKKRPFQGCIYCKKVCLYKEETRRLLSPDDVDNIRKILLDPLSRSKVSETLVQITQRWLGLKRPLGQKDERDPFEVDEISYCIGLHIIEYLNKSEAEKLDIARIISRQLTG